jgi:hypothetical protein
VFTLDAHNGVSNRRSGQAKHELTINRERVVLAECAGGSVVPAQPVEIECLLYLGILGVKSDDLFVLNVMAGTKAFICEPLKHCPHTKFIAATGAKLDAIH